MLRQIHKYSSVDTELGEYDPSPLSPISKLVHKQWRMDEKDELLIDGYYRECNITSYTLSYDVRQVIISYYLKKYSKATLKRKIHEIVQQKNRRKEQQRAQRKQTMTTILKYILIFIAMIGIFGLMLSPDIAAIIIVNINNCNLAIDGGGSSNIFINLGVDEYLSIGSIIHIIFVVLLPILFYIALQFKPNDHETILYHIITKSLCLYFLLYLFIISWSIVGGILYSKMDESTPSNQQCSDMVISWVVIKLIYYVVCIPLCICYIVELEILVVFVSTIGLFLLVVILLIIPDIAGLIIIGTNECDDGSNEDILGIWEWLLIGCISHIVVCIMQWEIYCLMEFEIVEYTQCKVIGLQIVPVCCSAICFVVWCIIGLVIISETNSENKQCKDMVISWIVIRFIECIAIKASFCFCLALNS